MDKVMEQPEIYIFYNLGASALQVSVVRYYSYQHRDGKYGKAKTVGALEVLSKAWDSTLGGNALDHLIVEHLAEEFNRQWKGGRVQDDARAMTKLRLQANRIKHVLSANTEIPIHMDALHDDHSLNTHMTRAKLEELAHSLVERSVRPIAAALKSANVTLDQIAAIELIGGGMRVPKIQSEISEHLNMELGLHLNSDESMALGAAFYGANISTAFKVRHVGLIDVNPFTINVSLNNLISSKTQKKKKDEDEEEAWSKQATMFKSFAKLGIKKTIAFTHDEDVHCAIDYEENEFLPEGTS
jgi:hypoxia up-regulated 1